MPIFRFAIQANGNHVETLGFQPLRNVADAVSFVSNIVRDLRAEGLDGYEGHVISINGDGHSVEAIPLDPPLGET